MDEGYMKISMVILVSCVNESENYENSCMLP